MDVTGAEQPRLEARSSRPAGLRDKFERWASAASPWLVRLAPLLIGLLTAILAFERLPRNTRRTLWAEDGPLFLGDALRGQHDLFAVYAGYLHVIPRAAALAVVNLFQVRSYSLAINWAACLVTGLVAVVVYQCSEDLVPTRALRVWLALLTVLLPVLGVEVLANLANLHSVLMWGAFWTLVRAPRTLWGAALLACFALLAALSEVQTSLLAPLVLLMLWQHRSFRHCLVVAGWAAGVACQTWSAWTHDIQRSPHLLSPKLISQLLGLEIAMPLWNLHPWRVRALVDTYSWSLAVLAALPIAVGVALCLRHGSSAQRLAVLGAVGTGLLVFCASHMLNIAVMEEPGYVALESAPILTRYAVVPSLLFVSSLALGTAASLQKGLRRPSWLGIASIAALLAGSAVHFRTSENVRDADSSWTKQLREARTECQSPAAVEVTVRVSPAPWQMAVPCARLR